MLQTHERFLRDYLGKVSGPALDHLWAITCGSCSEQLDSRWMRQTVGAIEATPEAAFARGLTWQQLAHTGSSVDLTELERMTSVLAEEDLRFLNDVKLTLREGVQIFEQFESHTLTRGKRQLYTCVQRLPEQLAGYYTRVSKRLAPSSARLPMSAADSNPSTGAR